MKRVHEASAIEKLSRILNKVNKSYQDVQSAGTDLERKVAQLELFMSKAQIVVNGANTKIEKLDAMFEQQQFQICEREVKSIRKICQEGSGIIENSEKNIIDNLQQIFTNNKESLYAESSLIKGFHSFEKSSPDARQAQINM
jgi:ferritin-like metal-binding protein YciE